mmetsp:Transcript_48599/g.84824  ORF Transcript_48599/g.84824 Transcript_48599/m.84824 type:complete len:90 (-) Transcript_48599:209-478(-)
MVKGQVRWNSCCRVVTCWQKVLCLRKPLLLERPHMLPKATGSSLPQLPNMRQMVQAIMHHKMDPTLFPNMQHQSNLMALQILRMLDKKV